MELIWCIWANGGYTVYDSNSLYYQFSQIEIN